MKRQYLALLGGGLLGGAFAVVACTGDDPALATVTDSPDGASSSGSSGTSSGSSGSSSGSSGEGGTDAGTDAPTDALVGFDAGPALLAFVQSGQYSADFGGIAQADFYCKGGAMNAGLPNASTDGAYLAWMADATQSPATRFKRSTTGYKRLDGVVIATSWEDLTDGTLAAPLNIKDDGSSAGNNALVWTNVAKDGTADSTSNNCGNWAVTTGQVGNYGNAATSDSTWTSSATLAPSAMPCANVYYIYCFQQKL